MEDVYMLADDVVQRKIGARLKALRLKQNITQQSLAEESGVSLSSVKKIEKGEIGSFDTFLRILRTLGKLDVLLPLVEEEPMSPIEYYELMQKVGAHQRKRAVRKMQKEKEAQSW